MSSVFVANFPTSVHAEDLRELFEEYGEVCGVKIWTNHRTGESEGWGFVEMEKDRDAERAIAGLDGFWWHQRKLKVSKPRPKRIRNGEW